MKIRPTPTEEEAAAALVAIAQFAAELAPAQGPPLPEVSRWKRAALAEGVSSAPGSDPPPPSGAAV